MTQPWYRDPVAWAVALPALALHAALANRYDVFRDELYFIVCGQHPSFGYVDQPPLVPLLAAGLYGLGHQLWLLRLPCVLAAAALVILTVRFVRHLGGGDTAAATAGIAVAFAPMFMGLTGTLNTTVFEPLAWTAIAYALTRAVTVEDHRAPIWGGIAAGLALEAKYALASWLVALAVGLLLTPERRILTRRELWLGVALAVLIAAPSIVWQMAHHWPFAELVAAAGDKNGSVSLPAFTINQVVVMNPLLAPLWLAGIVVPFVRRECAGLRFLSIAFVVVTALIYLSHGKDYYVAAAYPSMFAIGAIAFERVVRNAVARSAYLAAAVALSAVIAPVALPILGPAALHAYMQRIHVSPGQAEKSFAGTLLPQEFADQLGWHDFVHEVGSAYDTLPAGVRAQTAVWVGNYGEAAALDIYGAPYGLPPAVSAHNQYYLWGLRGQHPRNVLRVTRHTPAELRGDCGSVRLLGTTSSPWAMSYENGKKIVLCSRTRRPLADVFPEFKSFS